MTWKDKIYGLPSNNETMALIINKQIFSEAGVTKHPESWEDVAVMSKQIKDKTGKIGFGLVGKLNHGNTPYRMMPVIWGFGGGAFPGADAYYASCISLPMFPAMSTADVDRVLAGLRAAARDGAG